MSPAPIRLTGVAVLLAAILWCAASASASVGDLGQLNGTFGCVQQQPIDPAEGCAPGRGLTDAAAVAVSPDSKNVYALGAGGGLSVYSRAPRGATTDGELTQLSGTSGCVNDGGTDGCADGKLGAALAMARPTSP
jgi:hypothetical protein